jgi:alkanesulfonate monooxygenase SsuD/methylene tetrahydromethanopterin reductase-like flavin-dependent oxidoreductase (luciferase family)
MILPEQNWSESAAIWRQADELGFDSAWTYDHLWWDPLATQPWFSAFPVLAAAACVTTRIGLGTLVTSPNFRHPVVTAKEVITLDDISGGRFTLGIGAGAEGSGDAKVLGGEALSGKQRSDRFAEFVDMVDQLLRNEVSTIRGEFYSALGARMTPSCCRRPRVRFAVAATGPRGLEVAARHGDAWVTLGPPKLADGYSPDDIVAIVSAQVKKLRETCSREGRSDADLRRIYVATDLTGNLMASPQAFLRTAQQYAHAGITDLVVHWPRPAGLYAGDPAVMAPIAEWALPRVAQL